MFSALLKRLSRRRPAAALGLTGLILAGGTIVLLVMTIRDLRAGHLMRPVVALAVLILISIRLAASGLRRP